MGCDILDFRCIMLNEVIGSVLLAMIFVAIIYFIIASKSKLGFDTTLVFSVPLLLMASLVIAGFSAMYAFITLIVAIMIAWLFNKIIGNR